jgi:hypothetical protein
MKTKLLLVALIAVVAGIFITARATRRNRETIVASTALAYENAAMRGSIAHLERKLLETRNGIAQAEQKSAAILAESESAGRVLPGFDRESPARGAATAWRPSPETVIANDPQQMAEFERNLRDSLDFDWGAMFKALHLSSEQIAQFKELRVWSWQRGMDLKASAEMQGLDLNSDAFKQLLQEDKKRLEEKEADLFGPGPLLDSYREYRLTGYLRETVRRLASCEMYPDAPIPSAQVERVMAIVLNNSQRQPQKSWGQNWNTINWETATAQLRGVLSPSQIVTLQIFVQPRIAQAVIMARSAQIDAEAQKISRQPGG